MRECVHYYYMKVFRDFQEYHITSIYDYLSLHIYVYYYINFYEWSVGGEDDELLFFFLEAFEFEFYQQHVKKDSLSRPMN